MSEKGVPKWIEKYLENWLDPFLLDGIYGDLLEIYHKTKATRGTRVAQWQLIWNTLGFFRYRKLLSRKRLSNSSSSITIDMIINHIVLSLRSLIKNHIYTLINILGLTLSFAGCLLIALYVQEEVSYDRYHEKADRIYRLVTQIEGANFENGIAKINAPWGPEAQNSIPDVELACRFVFFGRPIVSKGTEQYYEGGGLYADSSVFKIFSWPFIFGDPQTALSGVNSLVLTEDLANKYFPGENPVGQSLKFDHQKEMKITAVIENIPEHSHFRFDFLTPMQGYVPPDQGNVWTTWNQYYTYLLLRKSGDRDRVAQKIDAMLAQHLDEETSRAYTPFLQPITKIHLHSKLHREMNPNSDISYLYIFSVVAILMLIIAATNFINLYTARATHRAKEVGVRKIIGATKMSIVNQFVIEAMIVSAVAGIFAILIAHLTLPSVNLVLERNLQLHMLQNPLLSAGLLAIVLLTGVLAGLYPALVLASVKVNRALKPDAESNLVRKFSGIGSRALFRKGLVVFQFGIATFLIVAALVVNGQLTYIQQKNLGFNKDQIIVIPMSTPETIANAEMIKNELLKIPGVRHVTASANRPGGSDYGVPYRAVGVAEDDQPSMRCLIVDEDFLNTYEIEMAQGRGFSKDMATDSAAYLINETAAAQLGWKNPLEHRLAMPAVDREPAPVIGVVKDFHFHSLHEPIGPLYFFMERTWYSQFSLKLNAATVDETLASLKQKWITLEPDHPFQYFFFDQSFESLHAAEARTAKMIRWFTYLAVFITCLGLFGLSAYTSERRTKEIGIRKILGASLGSILFLMMKEVLLLILLAIVLAVPVAWMVSNNWLENFAYTIDFGLSYILIAAISALAIALLTVSYHVLRSALSNPVKTLRYE
ncbi:MAG: ABC transporter permease [Saprospiraceae bacterium]|nr:ABC transporter permease [Saprospiraceae bacterium]